MGGQWPPHHALFPSCQAPTQHSPGWPHAGRPSHPLPGRPPCQTQGLSPAPAAGTPAGMGDAWAAAVTLTGRSMQAGRQATPITVPAHLPAPRPQRAPACRRVLPRVALLNQLCRIQQLPRAVVGPLLKHDAQHGRAPAAGPTDGAGLAHQRGCLRRQQRPIRVSQVHAIAVQRPSRDVEGV